MAYQHSSTQFALRRIVLLPAIVLAALLDFGATHTLAANQSVEIGRFTSSGTIALQLEKFHEQFGDGTRISEITVGDYNGYRVVRRKGNSASGECRVEMAPLMTGNGEAILSGSAVAAGTRVFLPGLLKVTLTGCSNNLCSSLAGVDGLGGHETLRAWCDQTVLSENRCRCHVVTTESPDIELAEDRGNLCTSWLDRLISAHVSEWVRFRYIE